MEKIKKEIKKYIPFNEQEEKDKKLILEILEREKYILTRENKKYHFTVSAWIVSPDRKKVLMCYHNLYNSWAWLGGHVDGDSNLKRVILKEIKEESGISDIKFLSEDIFSLEILTVSGHIKRLTIKSQDKFKKIKQLKFCTTKKLKYQFKKIYI